MSRHRFQDRRPGAPALAQQQGLRPAISISGCRPPKLPDETAVDGEAVAFNEDGKPSFNVRQTYGPPPAPVVFYFFDLMVFGGRDVTNEPLEKRRTLLETKVLPKVQEPVRSAGSLDATLRDLV